MPQLTIVNYSASLRLSGYILPAPHIPSLRNSSAAEVAGNNQFSLTGFILSFPF
jgi:hypothetical protein